MGAKDDLLEQLLKHLLDRVVVELEAATAEHWVDSVLNYCRIGLKVLLDAPDYTQQLVNRGLSQVPSNESVRQFNQRAVAVMAAIVERAKSDGDLADWVQPLVLAWSGYLPYAGAIIAWSREELDEVELFATGLLSTTLVFAGATEVQSAALRGLRSGTSSHSRVRSMRATAEARLLSPTTCSCSRPGRTSVFSNGGNGANACWFSRG